MNHFKKIISLISISVLSLSCKTQQPVVDKNDVYEVVYKSQIGGKKEKSNLIIKNYEDFNALISELNIDEQEYEKLLSIDLEKHDLLVCFLGEKNTGGYDIDIDNVIFSKSTSDVTLKELVPEKNAMVTMVITAPYMFVTLPKNKTILVK
ncbi:protease complex subunit PrcB family protein [Flavobacterium sp. F372]|uniref:Protease complex subunit PrcB family protein n=1 Tax=Flavobacterium bernardetii TaxID=2813823 RepID=A0ABR7IWG0_9FLAO|nr:protease complex subunit PrcB family protein [Flavobacterium bernardetii]MBC5834101.1 protease complex subunit PrcB family protein [Flavobacterium bernardetii]NHF69333.1 protease complex subunit PrcB family protein [Flavobacterium bernardetii]